MRVSHRFDFALEVWFDSLLGRHSSDDLVLETVVGSVRLPLEQQSRTANYDRRLRQGNDRGRSTCKIPVRSMLEVGGHPGIYPSTGITASTGPTTAWLPRKIPPLQPQAPTATTRFGEGIAS